MIGSLLPLLAAAAAALARDGDAPATIVDASFRRQPASRVTLDAGSAATDAGTIPLRELLSIRLAGAPATRPADGLVLSLRDGSRLAGTAVSLAQDALVWRSPAIGERKFPIDAVARIERGDAGAAADSATTAPSEDVALLRNGDRVAGIVSGATAEKLTIQATDGTPTAIDWTAVRSLRFAATGGDAAPAAAAPAFAVALRDGSRLSIVDATLDEQSLKGTWRGEPVTIDRGGVESIVNLAGRTRLLAYRPPAAEQYQPYFPRVRPPEASGDRDADALTVRPARPRSTLSWAVEPNQTLHARYAMPAGLPRADVTLRVLAGDRVAVEKQHVRAGDSGTLDVPLGDATRLTLVVDYGDDLDVQDDFAWLDLALVAPPPEQPK